jgi:hypothetical protein
MSTVTRFAGFLWAAPLTLLGIIYASVFTLLGWYTRTGTYGDALVWNLDAEAAPKWVTRRWLKYGGHTCGNVAVLVDSIKTKRGTVMLRHQQEHVRQFMVFGIFQPIIYTIASFGLLFCRHAHPHYDNPFEIDARRASGRVIDVIGALQRAVAEGKYKVPAKK